MDKVMIVGAGAVQTPLISRAKKLGFDTVVASIDGPYPGLSLADEVAWVDLRDAEAVAEAAAQLGVVAIVGCGNDMSLPAQAAACRRTGLPGLSDKAALASVNKAVMKEAFFAAGVSCASSMLLRSELDLDQSIEKFGFPFVIKAVDLTGSAGVSVVRNREEAREAFELSMSLTNESFCMAEEFLEGENFGAEALVQNGRVLFVLADGSIIHEGRTRIPVGHYMPYDRDAAELDAIAEEVKKAIAACDCDNCAVNFDLIWRDGKPYVVELSARAGSTCLPELQGQYFGVDFYEILVMVALGRDVSAFFDDSTHTWQPVAASMITASESGVLEAIDVPSPLPDYVRDLTFYAECGDEVHAFERCRDRLGQLVVTGENVEESLQRLRECLDDISISVSAVD